MSQRPTFSVIIPTFNRVELLRKTLESVWSQAFTNYEVIVVDDGSTDRTSDYLRSTARPLKALKQANRGPGAARNEGARCAAGTYLAFLDSDDIWFPWTLVTYHDVVRECGEPSFIAGSPVRFQDENDLKDIPREAVRFGRFPDYLVSGDQWRWWGVSSFVVRRDAFLAAGGFTKEWVNGEDADLALRLGAAPGFVQITSPRTFAYREQEVSAVKDAARTAGGAWLNVRAERDGQYPGGSTRAFERRRILTRHIRPVTLDCLRDGFRRDAWRLYGATFAWNAAQGRLRYLAAFPLIAAASRLQQSKIGRLIWGR